MGAFIQEMFHAGLYKRTQGRITRQVTAVALVVVLAFGCWRLMEMLIGHPVVSFTVPGVLFLATLWFAYRLVNVPAFADFLIAVEAEMNKVSWPTRTELVRSAMVVLVTIFVLATMLFVFDTVWGAFFKSIGVLSSS